MSLHTLTKHVPEVDGGANSVAILSRSRFPQGGQVGHHVLVKLLVKCSLAALLCIVSLPVTSDATTPSPTPTPTLPKVTGLVMDKAKRVLVDANCIYFWPKDATSPDGWAPSLECVQLDDNGGFITNLAVGDYKILVEAANVLPGMFVGGTDITKATTITVTAKGISGLVLKVDVMTKVTGRVLGLNERTLIGLNCVYFWAQPTAPATTWAPLDDCAYTDELGAFTAYLPPGTFRAEILAANVADGAFAGTDGSAAKATLVKVAAKTLTGVILKVPVQPTFAGRIANQDGSTPGNIESVRFYAPDASSPTGWTAESDNWWVYEDGSFEAYLSPGAYRMEFVPTSGSSTFFGGATVATAQTLLVPTIDLVGMTFRIGKSAPVATVTEYTVTPNDGTLQISWAPTWAAGTVAFSTVTATPGGGTCYSASTSCTLRGLTNGTRYTLNLSTINSGGITSSPLGEWVPAPLVPRISVDQQMVLPGSTVTMRISNCPANLKLTIKGTKVTTQSVTTSMSGTASVPFTLASAGVTKFTVSGGPVKGSATVYVPSMKIPSTAKVGKAITVTASGLPTGAQITFASGSTRIAATASSRGAAAAKLTFTRSGSQVVSATYGNFTISSASVAVSP